MDMKKRTIPSGPRAGIEKVARQQGVKPIRTRQSLYRHSVLDDENLDAWLMHLESLRLDRANGRMPKP